MGFLQILWVESQETAATRSQPRTLSVGGPQSQTTTYCGLCLDIRALGIFILLHFMQ